MRTPRPWIDTYIYTHSDSHINYTFTRVFIRTQTYIHLQGCILYAYVHTHIYIYKYITGANVTPRHGWTCIGAAAACKCRQYELPDCGGRVLKSYTYIYIWMCLKMACPMSMDYSLVSQMTVWRAYTRPMFKHVHIYI